VGSSRTPRISGAARSTWMNRTITAARRPVQSLFAQPR
jgi:hypothetical protein